MKNSALRASADDGEGDIGPIVGSLNESGYAHTFADAETVRSLSDRSAVYDAFERELGRDPDPGNRIRSYGRVLYHRVADRFSPLSNSDGYTQSADYNPDAEGKTRHFVHINGRVLTGRTLQLSMRRHIAVADQLLPDIASKQVVTLGVHFVRYEPRGNDASFSSPLGLHRDQERLVSVVLFSATSNLGGGENILSPNGRSIDALIKMSQPLETLMLTRKGLHAVMPMYSSDGRPAHRDIIIITID